MRSKTLKGLTYGQYANHRKTLGLTGQTKQSVAAAVKSRRIATLPDGSIDPQRADAQWQARTDPGKQRNRPANSEKRAPKAPRRVEDGKVESQGAGIEDAIHGARVSALADITAVADVLAFAKDCARLGCSREVSCALAQCYSVRASRALPDLECDDFDAERFGDPTPEEWRAVLGDVDLSEAEQLCDLVTL
jgi:hypothetical protein